MIIIITHANDVLNMHRKTDGVHVELPLMIVKH